MKYKTFPDHETLKTLSNLTHPDRRPSMLPIAASAEECISAAECDAIIEYMAEIDSYQFPHCNAQTREVPHPNSQVFDCLSFVGLVLNEMYWRLDLDDVCAGAWMQTYRQGDYYDIHVDAAPGQMRKLTAVLMLSDPEDYAEGDLTVKSDRASWIAPRTRGAVIVFPSWVPHHVTPVRAGVRQTINMGWWGPNFR